jgi:hypothetical protein
VHHRLLAMARQIVITNHAAGIFSVRVYAIDVPYYSQNFALVVAGPSRPATFERQRISLEHRPEPYLPTWTGSTVLDFSVPPADSDSRCNLNACNQSSLARQAVWWKRRRGSAGMRRARTAWAPAWTLAGQRGKTTLGASFLQLPPAPPARSCRCGPLPPGSVCC